MATTTPRSSTPRRSPWILVALLVGALVLWFALNFGAAAGSGSLQNTDSPTTGQTQENPTRDGPVTTQPNAQPGPQRP